MGALDKIADITRLSPMQENIFFHKLLQPDSHAYCIDMAIHINGHIDHLRLTQALNAVVEKHAALRSLFSLVPKHGPLRMVLKKSTHVIAFEDISYSIETEPLLENIRAEKKIKKYNLAKDKLLTLSLIKTGVSRFVIIINYHHILMDGWSMALFLQDITRHYSSGSVLGRLSPQPDPFDEYIKWIGRQQEQNTLLFWTDYLEGLETSQRLTQYGNNPSADYNAKRKSIAITRQQSKELANQCAQLQITTSTFFKFCWALTVSQFVNSDDIVYGTVITDRPSSITGIEDSLGLYINAVPIRIVLKEGKSIRHHLLELQSSTLNSIPHQYMSTAKILSVSKQKNQLIDHILIIENYELSGPDLSGHADDLQILNVDVTEQTGYDLNIIIVPKSDTLIHIDYNSSHFEDDFIQRLMQRYITAIDDVLKDIDATTGVIIKKQPSDSTLEKTVMKNKSTVHRHAVSESAELLKAQEFLHRCWTSLLAKDHIHPEDNFFDVGGTSMKVIDLYVMIQSEHSERMITIPSLYSNPTIRQQALLMIASGSITQEKKETELIDL